MIETSKRYSDKDLAEFKTLIQDKITSAKRLKAFKRFYYSGSRKWY